MKVNSRNKRHGINLSREAEPDREGQRGVERGGEVGRGGRVERG